MRPTKDYDIDLVCGLENISAVWGEPVTTTARRAAAGELPVARLGHMLVGNRKQLTAARARREATRNAKRGATNETARANECEGVT